MTEPAAPAIPVKSIVWRDLMVMVVGSLTVLGAIFGAYNSYTAKFTDLNTQIYELKNDANLIKARLSYAEDIIRTIQTNEDRAATDTRNRLDAIAKSISEAKDDLHKGLSNVPSRKR